MKKGFTLVELLAVIIIIGLLSVLIVPKVNKTLKQSEQKTNMASAEGLLRAAEYKYQDNEINGIQRNITIDYTNNDNNNYLEYSGSKPEKGKIQIRFDGLIAMSIKIGDYCYIKSFTSNEITKTPYDENVCGNDTELIMNYELPEITQSEDGLYESKLETGKLIFKGANPNNYIKLKENNVDTMYRILSYEPDGTIKVIRYESIGNLAWDERTTQETGPRYNSNNTYCQALSNNSYLGCNVWGNTNNTYYNDNKFDNNFFYKYYPESSSNSFQNGSFIGTVTIDSYLNTYLNTTFINTLNFKNYIVEHFYDAGGIYYHTQYIGGDKGINKEKEEQQIYKWKGKIGLPIVTEIVETSTNSTCTSVYSNYGWNPKNYEANTSTAIYESGEWPCSLANWIYKGSKQWTMTPNSSGRQDIYEFTAEGSFRTNNAYLTSAVYPTFYLKASTKLSGSGTSTNPYYIVES